MCLLYTSFRFIILFFIDLQETVKNIFLGFKIYTFDHFIGFIVLPPIRKDKFFQDSPLTQKNNIERYKVEAHTFK